MQKDRLSKLILIIILLGATAAVIFLASSRNLPFLTQSGLEYSIIPIESQDASSDYSIPDDFSFDESDESASSDTVSVPKETVNDFLSKQEVIQPTAPVYDLYNSDINSLKLVDTSGFAGINDGAVWVSMGYIYIQKGDESPKIYTPDGKDVSAVLEGTQPTVLRDTQGRPLFTDQSGSYYYLNENNEKVKSNYNHKSDNRGFTCEYPRYLGVQHPDIYKFASEKGSAFGYRTKGYEVIPAIYYEAFAFSKEGVGCLIQKYMGVENLIFYNLQATMVSKDYFSPETRGEEALGYFYFDDGLTRVRSKDKLGYYTELIMTYDGATLPIPSDYSVKGYTDSRILLEKNGKFGYMTSRLQWITLPEYTSARPFYEGLAVVGKDGKYGVIDTNGETVIPIMFDSISNCSDGIIVAYEESVGYKIFAKVQQQ